jgi:hypothetical protein
MIGLILTQVLTLIGYQNVNVKKIGIEIEKSIVFLIACLTFYLDL